jgi:hypothetical protein
VGLSFGVMGFSVDTPAVILALCIFAALWLYIRWQNARVTVPSERGAILGLRQTTSTISAFGSNRQTIPL